MAVLGSWISAFFILVANSWMQHPVGVEMVDGRPRMNDIGAVLMNPTAWVTFPHVITASIQVAGGFLVGIAWSLVSLTRAHATRRTSRSGSSPCAWAQLWASSVSQPLAQPATCRHR